MSSLNKKEEIESSSPCRSLAVTIQEELGRLPRLSQTKKRCIYRIPKRLRQVKEEAYTPVVVSIGPFHHKNARLLPMETPKLRHLESFIRRSEQKGHGDLNTYIEIIKDKERQIRDCYAEEIPMSSDEFVGMILIDSIFIIEHFCCGRRIDIMPTINYLHLHFDLMLAENQLPFFILDDLYSAAFKPHEPGSFMDIACRKLEVDKSRVKVDPITNQAACFHLLDLQRSHYLPSHQNTNNTCVDIYDSHSKVLCPTATSLHEAGVRFRVKDDETLCRLTDIDFDREKGILAIPKLMVMDSTDSWFRNLIAFEQCHYYPDSEGPGYIVHYRFFMDCLINRRKDVQLLSKAGIIQNWLGSDEQVSDLFNSLGTHVRWDTRHYYYYATISQQLNDHCDKRWNRYRATLKHTYFKHPWAALSVIYAVILLLLTIAQVLTGILAVPGVMK